VQFVGTKRMRTCTPDDVTGLTGPSLAVRLHLLSHSFFKELRLHVESCTPVCVEKKGDLPFVSLFFL